jgi:mannosyl-oligosaccharide alpha-1,2-mannosidase
MLILFYRSRAPKLVQTHPFAEFTKPPPAHDDRFDWTKRPQQFPVRSFIPLPNGTASEIPKIQYAFEHDFGASAEENDRRRAAIKSTFIRGWEGYKNRAWLKDELLPISGGSQNHFGGWAATMVDSLDTLWIMDLKVDFAQALGVIGSIDFTQTEQEEINVFETTIRYLGGLLAAWDLCGEEGSLGVEVLMAKAVELGEFLYAAFDTANRMPIMRWRWKNAKYGAIQQADDAVLLAEIGSLSVEFTRLSQITGDPKFYDAVQRITDRFETAQDLTNLPGLWPIVVNPKEDNFGDNTDFSIGAMADSTYEYLLKEHILLGGRSTQYWGLYNFAIDAAEQYLFFRPMTKSGADILIPGDRHGIPGTVGTLDPRGQHLSCFVGGMLALGSKVFERPDDLVIARKLVNGCLWAYHSMPTGIMPETFHVTPCTDPDQCTWVEQPHSEDPKNFPEFFDIPDKRYILRPEAIESLFVLYRVTGDETLRDEAWKLFEAIDNHTKTEYGNAALSDVTRVPAPQTDSMESFWTAETLKYFYLIFSPPEVLSLDEWVFNTEAHPFKRP